MQKGEAVEDLIDLRFFRPLGIRVARALAPTRVTPNRVTLWSLLAGVVGGHLFVYKGARANALGLGVTIFADVLDSTDGQLARLRGTSSRWGRVLDGYADSLRWAVIYVHLLVRDLRDGGGVGSVAAALAASQSHRLQAEAIDFAYSAYLIAALDRGHLDLPEDFGTFELPRPWWGAVARWSYRGYARRQALLMPYTADLLRRLREGTPEQRARFAPVYAARQAATMRLCALLGQNAHLALLGAAALAGRPAAYFWGCLAAGTPLLALLVLVHERRSRRLLRVWQAIQIGDG
jgi:hypothetical protein